MATQGRAKLLDEFGTLVLTLEWGSEHALLPDLETLPITPPVWCPGRTGAFPVPTKISDAAKKPSERRLEARREPYASSVAWAV